MLYSLCDIGLTYHLSVGTHIDTQKVVQLKYLLYIAKAMVN